MKVTITIEDADTRTVMAGGESASSEEAGSPEGGRQQSMDGGAARAAVEGGESEVSSGVEPERPAQAGAAPMDAGAAPVLASEGDGHGPLPLGRSKR
ncbi:MAG TPA: hypothetical protein VHH92_08090, partial [Actinomycetota bacterium]|nr:hypothetical protein [Actinomycetota bacterium]